MSIVVRRAVAADIGAACELVRRSITELCVLDHQRDESTIAAWVANKTPDNFAWWISSPRHIAIVAESDGELAGFALLNNAGTVALLYVAPPFRFRRVSKALLLSLEEHAIALGIAKLTLESSATALPFYQRCGYLRTGDTVRGFGTTRAYPLVKSLAGPDSTHQPARTTTTVGRSL